MDGILAVDKPRGMTSHDVVDYIRRRFGLKKVGHAGTLDPMATGVLVVLIGEYTKASSLLINDDKEYSASLVLGAISDTGDAFGKITLSDKKVSYGREEIENAFKRFTGQIIQTPPAYSAIKYKGRPLYELARRGINVEVKPRKVFIEKIEVLKIDLPEVAFHVRCSKGTYIRKIASDIGEALGCGAYLSSLKRTRSGVFCIDGAIGLDKLKDLKMMELEKRLYRQ